MKKEPKFRYLTDIAYYSSLGMSVALSIFIGLFMGHYLDGRFDTAPVLTFVFLGLGIAAGFRNILLAVRKAGRND